MPEPAPDRAATPGAATPSTRRERATLAGGCFWCLEPVFDALEGVERVVPGYTGGRYPNPSYREVSSGLSGHAEAVEVTFDPARISYRYLLEVFFTLHDPTTLNRQGADVGPQYRSVVFYHSDEQKTVAGAVMLEIEALRLWSGPIVTELRPAGPFYPAEEVHHRYYERNPEAPYCQAVITPKLAKLRRHFTTHLKQTV